MSRLAVLLPALAAALVCALSVPAGSQALGAPCTPDPAAGVKAVPSQIQPVVAEINKVRAAAGLAAVVPGPSMEKMAMFEAFSQTAGAKPSDPSMLAHDCATGYEWYIGWGPDFESAKQAVAGWMSNPDMKNMILRSDCSDDPTTACAVGVGVAVKGSSSTWVLAFDDTLGDDPLASSTVWPVAGWPTLPTTTTLPSSGSNNGGWTYQAGTKLCLTPSQCGQFEIDTTWRPNGGGSLSLTPARSVSVCISVDSWDDGGSAPLTPRIGAATLLLHLDKATVKIANPGWSAGSDSSQSCADVNLPAPASALGRHDEWLAITTASGDTLESDHRSYGMPLIINVFAFTRARVVYLHGQPSYDLLTGSVASPLFSLASPAHPITVSCVEVRSNGTIRKVDSTFVVRHPVGERAAGRCVYRVKPPFGISLQARLKTTPWLARHIGGQKIRYGGLQFG